MFRSVVLFSEPFQQQYKAPRLSLAYLFKIVAVSGTLVLPLFLAYPSDREGGSFWKKSGSYREQPHVEYLYTLILEAQTLDQETGLSNEFYFSTSESASALGHIRSQRMAEVSVSRKDVDLDGIADSFYILTELPLKESEHVLGIKALTIFDYELKHRVKAKMESVAYISHDSRLPGSRLAARGAMKLNQCHPSEINELSSLRNGNEVQMKSTGPTRPFGETSIGHILAKQYSFRDVRATYEPHFSLWHHAIRSTAESPQDTTFRIELVIDIPVEEIHYRPTFAELVRNAWEQYLAMFAITALLVRQICQLVYSSQILATQVVSDHDVEELK